jgi:ABC-type uncharacterized transport system substrate-binding protein
MDVVRRSLAACILFLSIGGASAHPHVWVILKCKVIFDDSGSVVALLYSRSFDEMTSAFTTLGIKGRHSAPTREELAPAASEQIASLRKVDFFTTMKVGNVSQRLLDAADYWLDFDGKLLTLHFSLPVNPARNLTSMTIEIYDPSYFVDIRFADANPVELAQAPKNCKSSIVRQTWTQTANKILVTCERT